jgi:hypothetical protein
MDIALLRAQWAEEFAADIAKTKSPTKVAHSLAMVGVNGPGEPCFVCGAAVCDGNNGDCGLGISPSHNRAIHAILRSTGMLHRVRRVIRDDLGKNKIFAEDRFALPLLEHFLKATPTQDWVK